MAAERWARMRMEWPDGTHLSLGLGGDGPPHLGAVDRVARLALAARWSGGRLWLEGVCPELAELLDLAGLRQVRRQVEGGEEPVGVEEGVDPDHLAP